MWRVAIGVLAGSLIGWAWASAVDVEMKPAACYTIEAIDPVDDSKKHGFAAFALVFNTCEPGFRWYKVPNPPESEA